MSKLNENELRKQLMQRTEGYAASIRHIYDDIINKLVKLAMKVEDGYDPSKPFNFSDYPAISKDADKLFQELYTRVYAEIKKGVNNEFAHADRDANALVTSFLGASAANNPKYADYFKPGTETRKSFFADKAANSPSGNAPSKPNPNMKSRRRSNLSSRVWELSGQAREEIELALSDGRAKGMSAQNIAKRIQKYLIKPDMLFRRFRIKTGTNETTGETEYGSVWKRRYLDKESGGYKWEDYDPKDYHPGRGVYRSSYKNAMRLARTETNMAYHQESYERWQQLDFVIGFRVVVSDNHPEEDICDKLAGEYPKDFLFVGWHPQCRCHTISILKGNGKEVTDVPANFKDWLKENRKRIEGATERGTLPYFLQDNAEYAGWNEE